jgi:Winged helix-turn-helix DNA-binding
VNVHEDIMSSENHIEHQEISLLLEGLNWPSEYFVRRDRGRQAFERVQERLLMVHDGGCLVLSFPDDQLMDASFAEELIVKLIKAITEGDFGDRGFLLQNLSEDSILNLNSILRLRNYKLAILAVEVDGGWHYIGQLEASLFETLNLIYQFGSLTAQQLSEMLNLAINSASNRLKKLHDLRLVRRDQGITLNGLQYTYHIWKWTEKIPFRRS